MLGQTTVERISLFEGHDELTVRTPLRTQSLASTRGTNPRLKSREDVTGDGLPTCREANWIVSRAKRWWAADIGALAVREHGSPRVRPATDGRTGQRTGPAYRSGVLAGLQLSHQSSHSTTTISRPQSRQPTIHQGSFPKPWTYIIYLLTLP